MGFGRCNNSQLRKGVISKRQPEDGTFFPEGSVSEAENVSACQKEGNDYGKGKPKLYRRIGVWI